MLRDLRALPFATAMIACGLFAPMHAAAEIRDPLPRFEDRICPGVAGLPVSQAELLVGRIRANVGALGLVEADAARCEPNIIVAVVPDGQAYLQDLEARKPYLFGALSPVERRELLEKEGPVRAFLTTATRTRDGIPVYRRESMTAIPQMQAHAAHSKIYTAARRDILSALVLFDAAAIEGKSIAQLADHATMLALLTQLPEQPQDSVLTMFDEGSEAATGLTPYDRAYLQAMYEGLPNIPSDVRLAEVEQRTSVAAATAQR